METNGNIEILVHVAAPCKAVDDARYRALAQAYLDFQPVGQTKILGGFLQGDAHSDIAGSQGEPSPSPSTPFYAPIPSSEATQLPSSPPVRYTLPEASFGSVQLSFRSVLDNRNSPILGRAGAVQDIPPSSQPDAETQFTQSSWVAPPSVIGDSQPANDISLAEFSSPSRLFEHLACQFESQGAVASQQTPSQSQRRVPQSSQGLEKELEDVEDDGEDDEQVVLVTSSEPPSASDVPPPHPSPPAENVILDTPFSARKRPLLESSPLDQVIQETPCQASGKRPSVSSPSRGNSDSPLPRKRHKRSAPISESRSATRSPSLAGPVIPDDLYSVIRPPNTRHLNYLERLEIHPEGPPVGNAELTPDDLLTPKLRELARQLNIDKRFRPIEQMRELRPFERGHWILDWTGWRPTLRERAWHFLTDYILEGFAGWGVWCTRAEDWSWLRVYCWGYVAGHVYLALYLASERALKTDTARWVDGAGEVILVTNGHGNSESGDSMEDGADE
ncbi:hypothetical protein CGCA056_v000708 [Colletotrichum aenigma]|uniref:uncharacterized protein n=1 Tax=Colletotrichum aenigma TaxID=1215731 RepID=UPI001872BF41|nr:uncharacterized protein CGCA056_v000708 [Colletotrichum aenigma]KAF5527766.1 hypothetical protein CGCA056_v000708 [Colletotrichum aenigma]